MRRRKLSRVLFVYCVAMAMLGALGWRYWANVSFLRLWWHRRDHAVALSIADTLSLRQRGVELALDDMGLFGGTTRGWSSYILRTSPIARPLEQKLQAIIASEQERPSRRLEASFIMWERTGVAVHLETVLEMIRDPGPAWTQRARRKLAATLGYRLSEELEAEGNTRLTLSVDDLRSAIGQLQDEGRLRKPSPQSTESGDSQGAP